MTQYGSKSHNLLDFRACSDQNVGSVDPVWALRRIPGPHSARFLHFITFRSGMNPTQGEKKSNCLVKPANDLITTNEYTLDLIPSPLFSVYILDSQIPANKFSAGCHRHEKSHMIQNMSLDNSIWRGEVWSKIYLKIKSGKTFSIVQIRECLSHFVHKYKMSTREYCMSLTVTRSSCNLQGTRLLAAMDRRPLWQWIHKTHSNPIFMMI